MATVSLDTARTGAHRRRLWLALVGLALAIFFVPFSTQVESKLETAVHIEKGEAESVDNELANRFQSAFVNRVVLVVEGLPDPDSPKGVEALGTLARGLKASPGVSGVLSRLDWKDRLFLGKGGGTFLLIGLSPHERSVENLIPGLQAKVAQLQSQLRVEFPNLKLQITGDTPLNYDLRQVSSDDVHQAESRALPITLILLLLAFGSVVAALLPLGIGILAISMTMGAAALLAHFLHLSILMQNLATMLGLGLGIDYALLMLSRFREALNEGHSAGVAADLAACQAGYTLLISASTVAIGFAALLTVPISELRSLGVAGLLVAAMSVLLCTCVLPWILGLLGHRINAGLIRLPAKWGGRWGGQGGLLDVQCSRSMAWHRWGCIVTGRPWLFLLLAGAPLLVLSWHARRISPGLPSGDWLPTSAASVRAIDSLNDMDRGGIVPSLRIVLDLPADAPPLSAAGWAGLSRLTRSLAADPRTLEVISLPSVVGMAPTPGLLRLAPAASWKSLISTDSHATLLEVIPATKVQPNEGVRWVRELRAADAAQLTGIPGAKIRVGGVPAQDADYDAVVKEWLPRVMRLVVLGSLVALLIGLRGSIFAAFKAVLLNLLSVGASFGVLVLVFQDGHGAGLFGAANATGSVFPIVPILSFALVFGLSMDYEVFLVARVLEERRRGLAEREAVVEALACTAGLITSAAAIMIAVFSAFTLGSFLVIKTLGFTLAVAVLIDATVVRMIVGPALLQLAGDWNWWPLGLRGAEAAPKPSKPIVPAVTQ